MYSLLIESKLAILLEFPFYESTLFKFIKLEPKSVFDWFHMSPNKYRILKIIQNYFPRIRNYIIASFFLSFSIFFRIFYHYHSMLQLNKDFLSPYINIIQELTS